MQRSLSKKSNKISPGIAGLKAQFQFLACPFFVLNWLPEEKKGERLLRLIFLY
jgi:hypothetical protein